MPSKALFIIEDVPSNPVVAAIAGTAVGAIEGCDFQIQLMQNPNITSKDDTADALKILSANSQGKAARKAVSDNLTAIIMLKESYVPGFIITTGTSKAVLSNGS